jgi:hypothetical protein
VTHEERETIVHDLKNQLAIIVGFADCLLADVPAADPRFPDVEEIRAAAERAGALLRRLEGEAGPEGAGR